MKRQIKGIILINTCATVLLVINVWSQIGSTDSTLFIAAGNDTTKLRQIITMRNGERIAGKAQYKIALLAFNNKNEEVAEREFHITRNVYQGMPEAVDASYYLGVISLHNEMPGPAKKYFSEYISLDSGGTNTEWATYFNVKSMYRSKDIEYESAVRDYLGSNRLLTKQKESIVRSEFIRHLMDVGKMEEAIVEAKTLVRLFPNDVRSDDAQFKIGDILILQGKHDEAEAYYKSIMKNTTQGSEKSARAQFQLAGVYDSKGDFVSARREYFSTKQNYAQFPRWKRASEYALAMLTFKEWQKKPDSVIYVNAKKQIAGFVKNNPTDRHVPRALNALADLNNYYGDYDEAINNYDRILSFDGKLIPLKPSATVRSNDVKAFKKMLQRVKLSKGAVLLMYMHKPEMALLEYDELLDTDPNIGEALLHKALCLIELNRKSEAQIILQRLIQENGAESTVASQMFQTIID